MVQIQDMLAQTLAAAIADMSSRGLIVNVKANDLYDSTGITLEINDKEFDADDPTIVVVSQCIVGVAVAVKEGRTYKGAAFVDCGSKMPSAILGIYEQYGAPVLRRENLEGIPNE